jgi:hypothetical protein
MPTYHRIAATNVVQLFAVAKNCRFQFFDQEVQNQRTAGPIHFKNLQEPAVFMN